MNRKIILTCLSALLVTGIGLPAASASDFEFTPFVGYRLDGEFDRVSGAGFYDTEIEESDALGFILGFNVSPNLMIELMASRQATELVDPGFSLGSSFKILDLDVDYYHIGLLYQWRPGHIEPFVVGSLGATSFSPDVLGFSDETRFSVSLGGGVKMFISNHLGLRLEGRVFSTLIDRDDDVFCERNDCYRFDDSDYLTQSELRGGLIFRF